MQIVEVKNNLVKLSYNTTQENLILSGFVVIKDASQSFIAQIIHLEADSKGNFAIVKLLFNFDDNGVITNYNGSIPDAKCPMDVVNSQELLELLPAQNPIVIGELAQQKTLLTLDRSLFEQTLLICSERDEDNSLLIKNFASQLSHGGKKLLIIDTAGGLSRDMEDNPIEELDFSQNKITAGKDFKLPLNYETINFIYEKGLDDAKAETKALIQDVFLEVQNYVKTLSEKFIPFETFKNVVDDQYQETSLVELVLLKNKLLKYYEAGIFAQEKDEFNALKISLKSKGATILDLSQMEPEIQREMISYAYSLIAEINGQSDKEIYVMLNIDNLNSDKKLLKQIFTTKQAYSIPICSYSYRYLKELKQLSKNLILFAPIQQQNDFASYNVFLNKLNVGEFVIYGYATRHLPLIVKLDEIPKPALTASDDLAVAQTEVEPSQQDLLDEQIKRDVDEIYTTPKVGSGEKQSVGKIYEQNEFEEDQFSVEVLEDELTEDDLDLIDDLNIVESGPSNISEENVWQDADISAGETEEPQEDIEIVGHEQAAEQEAAQEANFLESLSEQEPLPDEGILSVSEASTPIVPIYSAEVEPQVQSDEIAQGDTVMHPKYGKGTVEKLINYGSKTLCSINFDNIGRRLLDPALAEIRKV